jgi:hypothetical protein
LSGSNFCLDPVVAVSSTELLEASAKQIVPERRKKIEEENRYLGDLSQLCHTDVSKLHFKSHPQLKLPLHLSTLVYPGRYRSLLFLYFSLFFFSLITRVRGTC